MLNVLPFASANFDDAKADQRNFIMTAICNATQCADLKVRYTVSCCLACQTYFLCLQTRLSAFECISLVASLYYTKLQPYMDVLFRVQLELALCVSLAGVY